MCISLTNCLTNISLCLTRLLNKIFILTRIWKYIIYFFFAFRFKSFKMVALLSWAILFKIRGFSCINCVSNLVVIYKLREKASLVLILTTPPSVNQAYVNVRTRGRVKAPCYIQWEKQAKVDLRNQLDRITLPLKTPYGIIYSINKTDNRLRDCANYEKCLSDFLVKMRIIHDDSYILVNIQEWMCDKDLGNKTCCQIFSNIGS